MSTAEDRGRARVGALSDLGAIRAEAAKLYRRGVRGELPAADAGRLSSVLALVARLVEGSELERRLAALEQRLAEREPKR